MSRKRYKPEQIVNLLRRTEVEIANGKKAAQAAREVGICEQAYYRPARGGWLRPSAAQQEFRAM